LTLAAIGRRSQKAVAFVVVARLRRKWLFLVGALALLAGAVLAAPVIAIFFAFPPVITCDQKVVREFPSPRGWGKAVVMRVNCHATTPFVTTVALVRAGEAIDLDKHAIFSVRGDDDIEVLWDGGTMTIVHDKPSQIYRKAAVWMGQPISYRERER